VAGYSVTYTVIDQATAQINAINRRIQQLRAPLEAQAKAMTKFVNVSGLKAMSDGFKGIAESATSAVRAVGALTPAMGALTGGSIVYGLAKLTTDFADWNRQLETTASLLDSTPQKLSGVEQAARSIGVAAKTAEDALEGLRRAQYEATLGLNPQAAAQFARMNVPLVDANKNFRDVLDVQGDVLRYFDKLPVGLDRAAAAARLLSPALAEIYNEFKASGLTVDQYLDRQRRMQTLSEQNRQNFEHYREAIDGLNSAFYDLGVKVAGSLAPALTPLIQQLTTWVEAHQPELIAGMQTFVRGMVTGFTWIGSHLDTIKTTAEVIAVLWGVKWVASIVQAGVALSAFVGSPAFVALASLAATIYAIKTLGAQGTGKEGSWTAPNSPNRFADPSMPFGAPAPEALLPPAAATPTPAPTPAPATPAPTAPATPGPSSATGTEGGAPAAFKQAIENVESPGGKYNNEPQPGHSATGPRQMMPDTFAANALPGERIDNPADNRRVSDRLIDSLWKKYNGDPQKVAYAYANGSLSSPDRNPGYVPKLMGEYQKQQTLLPGPDGVAPRPPNTPGGGGAAPIVDQMVALAGSRGKDVREFLRDPHGKIARDPDLGLWCAEFTNAYLQHVGVPGTGSLMARSFADWGHQVALDQVQKGDVLLNKNLEHVGVATGRTRMNNGNLEVEEISSNSIGPGGELLNIPGTRWRSDVNARRSDELAKLQARGPVGVMASGSPASGSVDVTVTHKHAPAGVEVTSTASGSGLKLGAPRVEHQQFGQI